jgi:predicted PurR-regulated permease PerM
VTDRSPTSHRLFAERVLILIAIAATAGLVLMLSHLLMMVFGAIVIAVLLTSITNPIQRYTRLPRGLALAASILIVLGVVGGIGTLFGAQIAGQARDLGEQIPQAYDSARDQLGEWGLDLPEFPIGRGGGEEEQAGAGNPAQSPPAEEEDDSPPGAGFLTSGMIGQLGGWMMTIFGVIAHSLVVLVGGIYFAAQPGLYRTGLLKLVPKSGRPVAAEAWDDSGKALKLWLLGTLVSMVLVGTLTGVGLWILGVPSALALGLLAGLLEFVPIIGPIAAAVPAVLIAFSVSPELAMWTAGLFLLIQQAEGNIIQPIVQRYAVHLPPALLLFSVVAAGAMFGIVGVLFAAPLTVVAFVLVKRLYVREALHTETSLPHERGED